MFQGEEPEEVRDYTNIKQVQRVITEYGPNKHSLSWPYLLAKTPNGELVVGNNSTAAKQIVVFDKELKYLRDIGSKIYEKDVHKVIRGIAVDKNGFIYVTEGKEHCIHKFRLDDGEFISKFGEEGSDEGQFRHPAGLLVTQGNGLLFVCDRHNHRIQVFQDNGKFFYEFGKFGHRYIQEPGTFNEPVDIAINKSETMLFVTDWRNNRVQMLTPGGKFRSQIKNIPNLKQPNGIFFTPDDHLLVTSTDHVLIFKEDGKFVSSIEGGKERFTDCIGIVMMENKKIVISDGHYGTNRLRVF